MSDFSDLMKEAELARAYINITNKMGPSEQLLAFIDYDNKLSSVAGLESFDWSSLEDRHQMLLNTLDPDGLESIAIESFGDWCKKRRASLLALTFFYGPLTFIPAIIGYTRSKKEGKVPKFKECVAYKERVTVDIHSLELAISGIPKGFKDVEAWHTFSDKLKSCISKSEAVNIPGDVEVYVDRGSGWTPDNFNETVFFVNRVSEKLEELSGKLGIALAPIQSFVDSDPKGNKVLHAVIEAGDAYKSLLNLSKSNHKELVRIVNSVKKCFVEKDKD